jgi:hypothetical protein
MRQDWIDTAHYWLARATMDRRRGARQDWTVCMDKVRLARRQIAGAAR